MNDDRLSSSWQPILPIIAFGIMMLLLFIEIPSALTQSLNVNRAGIGILDALFPPDKLTENIVTAIEATNLQKALSHLVNTNSTGESDIRTARMLGRGLMIQGNWEGAMLVLERGLTRTPTNPVLVFDLSLVYEHLLNSADSIRTTRMHERLTKTWQSAGYDVSTLVAFGELDRSVGSYDMALAWYQRASIMAPGNTEPKYLIGMTYTSMGKLEEAASVFSELVRNDPQNGDAWYQLGRTYSNSQDWNKASEAFLRGLDGHHEKIGLSNFYYWIGVIKAAHSKPVKIQGAVDAFEQAIQLNSFVGDPNNKTEVYFHLGLLRASQGDSAGALTEFNNALKLAPEHYWVRIYVASTLWGLNRPTDAIELLEKTVQLSPDKKNAYILLGEYYDKTGHMSEALAMFEAALRIDPTDETAKRSLESLNNE